MDPATLPLLEHLWAWKNRPPPFSGTILVHVLQLSSCDEQFDLDLPVMSIKILDACFKRFRYISVIGVQAT